jgi:hypothetical protein
VKKKSARSDVRSGVSGMGRMMRMGLKGAQGDINILYID